MLDDVNIYLPNIPGGFLFQICVFRALFFGSSLPTLYALFLSAIDPEPWGHFKKDSGRVRVAMNPIALYTDATPCPQPRHGTGRRIKHPQLEKQIALPDQILGSKCSFE